MTILNCWPRNAKSRSRILLNCASVSSLHANCFWSATRAAFSSSANLFNRAASFSFLEARSSASPAFCRASPFKPAILPSVAMLASLDKESILLLYGYAHTSGRTATTKQASAILSNKISRFLFKCANTSILLTLRRIQQRLLRGWRGSQRMITNTIPGEPLITSWLAWLLSIVFGTMNQTCR